MAKQLRGGGGSSGGTPAPDGATSEGSFETTCTGLLQWMLRAVSPLLELAGPAAQPLPALRRGVFFIRVMVCPLTEVLGVASGRAGELREALASMSDAVVAYRGMASVRERLCSELGAVST